MYATRRSIGTRSSSPSVGGRGESQLYRQRVAIHVESYVPTDAARSGRRCRPSVPGLFC